LALLALSVAPDAKIAGQTRSRVFPFRSIWFKEQYIMADTITELASKCGISPDMAKKGLGTLLAAFKHVLPAESFAKIEAAIPGADSMLADAQQQGEATSGGFFGAIKDMAGKLFGGGGTHEALAAHFGQVGFSPDQIKHFISHVVKLLESKLPPDVMKHIGALLPHETSAAPH
jgi:hypothetical protein